VAGAEWLAAGAGGELLWGSCRGSGKRPYQACVDLSGPAYRCSCPSRKFPCKHALALLLLWAADLVPDDAPPEWAQDWLDMRSEQAARLAARSAAAGAQAGVQGDLAGGGNPGSGAPAGGAAGGGPAGAGSAGSGGGASGSSGAATPAGPASARAGQRAARAGAGMDELDRWLCDQVRTGLAGTEQLGYEHFERVAARMVDAQAPEVAIVLRRLPGVAVSGPGWPGRLLEEYASLRLLAVAHRRLDELPAATAATVRSHVGYPLRREDVLVAEPVRDRWVVLGLSDTLEDRLTARRVWLRGRHTGRRAVVLSYAVTGQSLDSSLTVGTELDADLHFYPAVPPLRALVGTRHHVPAPAGPVPGETVREALAGYAAALAADPWLAVWPVVLAGVVPVPGSPAWQLAEPDGDALPVPETHPGLWRLLAVSGGRPVTVVGEWDGRTLRPLSVVDGAEVVRL
jgi:SWIM zinc finger